jgi:hypothetical protein
MSGPLTTDENLTALNYKMELLHRKVDDLTKKLDKMFEKKPKSVRKSSESKEFTVEDSELFCYFKTEYNHSFNVFIKENGGIWNVSKKGWAFPMASKNEIIEKIQLNFKDWSLI